jgi:glucose-6-phosphate isomerase
LGTIAVLEALQGKFYNNQQKLNVYFVDTVDTDYIHDITQLVEQELKIGNAIILNVISKSGTTTETVANFELFLELLKKYHPDNYHHSVVAITDENSALWKLAQEEKYTLFAIPDHIGGRYSVFSAVGLFPLCFLGIDIEALHAGAQSGYALSINTTLDTNPAAVSAALLSTLYQKGYIIHDTFIFSVELASIGAWYRQLMAESIGKTYSTDGSVTHNGITPTVSIGSTDLHSVAQLYLSGPYNRFTTFVMVEKNKTDLILPHHEMFDRLVPSIQGTSFATLMNAILEGTKSAYLHDKRPFITMNIPEKSAYYLGQWMQIKMIEIMYLGFLMNVNPFDQPQVELYKKETKKILATTSTLTKNSS